MLDIMELDPKVREDLKNQQIEQMKRRYFILSMQKAAHEANGEDKNAEQISNRMEALVRAVNAIVEM